MHGFMDCEFKVGWKDNHTHRHRRVYGLAFHVQYHAAPLKQSCSSGAGGQCQQLAFATQRRSSSLAVAAQVGSASSLLLPRSAAQAVLQ